MGPLGLFGRNFGEDFKDSMPFFKNGVREIAVSVHIGAQSCGKKATF